MMKTVEELRLEIAELVKDFASLKYKETPFIPGRTFIPASGKAILRVDL